MIKGIHHITAIASHPQSCFDFYTKTLGLRLVKKTVNQDQTEAYHLFFGDYLGNPGMDLTFFIFPNTPKKTVGNGVVSCISLAIPINSLIFWRKRFKNLNINFENLVKFNTKRITFFDPDGLSLELVGVPNTQFSSAVNKLPENPGIPPKHSIGYFYSSTLNISHPGLLDPILIHLGYRLMNRENNTSLYSLSKGNRACFIETDYTAQEYHSPGYGSVHHIAFEVSNETDLASFRESIATLGFHPTNIIDRYYFKSVYFRTPAGILFELATHGPGFTVNEPAEKLGENIDLPPFLEKYRRTIVAQLIPINQS